MFKDKEQTYLKEKNSVEILITRSVLALQFLSGFHFWGLYTNHGFIISSPPTESS